MSLLASFGYVKGRAEEANQAKTLFEFQYSC